MILSIDTSDQKEVRVFLKKEGKVVVSLKEENQFGSQVLLSLINKALKEAGVALEDLKEIEVKSGPGSYTGLKVGVSVANALGFSLGIPVNSKEMEVDLVYG